MQTVLVLVWNPVRSSWKRLRRLPMEAGSVWRETLSGLLCFPLSPHVLLVHAGGRFEAERPSLPSPPSDRCFWWQAAATRRLDVSTSSGRHPALPYHLTWGKQLPDWRLCAGGGKVSDELPFDLIAAAASTRLWDTVRMILDSERNN